MSTFNTPRPVEATIEFVIGAVNLRAAAVDTTTVEIHPTDPSNPEDVQMADDTTVTLEDDRLTIRGPGRQGAGIARSWLSRAFGPSGMGPSVDATIEIPTGSSVKLTLGSGDIDGSGHFGDCHLRTGLGAVTLDEADTADVKSGAGTLRINRVNGRTELTTATGQVDVGSVTGPTVVRNSNGLTRIGTADGELRVKSANGVIEIGTAHGNVVAKSANGDVRVDEVVRGTAVLETHVGNVEVGVREGTAAWLDLDAKAGSVHNNLDRGDAPGTDDEKIEIRARTTLGQIIIRRPHQTQTPQGRTNA